MKKKYNNVILLIALGLIAIIYILRHNFLITTYTYAIVPQIFRRKERAQLRTM